VNSNVSAYCMIAIFPYMVIFTTTITKPFIQTSWGRLQMKPT
jgi:hypothetical protein